jgi:hypothetical protein
MMKSRQIILDSSNSEQQNFFLKPLLCHISQQLSYISVGGQLPFTSNPSHCSVKEKIPHFTGMHIVDYIISYNASAFINDTEV